MYKQTYRCINHEPLVLFKNAKTEQSTETLEYLPGSLFRGIVATNLFDNSESEDLIKNMIFSKDLVFGDAHLVINKERSMPVPLSYHKNQLDDKVFENLAVKIDDRNKKKQIREGYQILDEKKVIVAVPEMGERMKAARDLEKRSSKEGLMYLYRFIEPNHTFEFEVKSSDKVYLEKVNQILNGKTIYLAKSKNAEFGGKVEVTTHSKIVPNNAKSTNGTLRLFAASNWCFLNEFGTFTAQITPEMLGVTDGTSIDWEKSFLRFRTYSPFNHHRESFDAPRLIIEKGSVITFRKKATLIDTIFNEGVGCFKNEGFGEVIPDPDSLKYRNYGFEIIKNINKIKETKDIDKVADDLLTILNNSLNAKKEKIENYKLVELWQDKKEFIGLGHSQWAKVYNAVYELGDTVAMKIVLTEKDKGLLVKSKHTQWENTQIEGIENLLGKNNPEAFKMFVKSMINEDENE